MRSFADMTGERELSGPAAVLSSQPASPPNGNAGPQVGSRPLGWETGAPPRTMLTSLQVIPAGFGQATQIVQGTRESRIVTLTAPFVGFSIFVGGDAGVKITDLALPPGLPYAIEIVGGQELWAVTDAPVYLPLRVQVAAILIGDRSRID